MTPATEALDVRRKRLPPGVVFLSACHETEVEPEFQEAGKTYGLLTRFLSQILTEHETLSELSYDLLHDAIRSRYQSNRRVVQAPHPQLEASDLDTRRIRSLSFSRHRSSRQFPTWRKNELGWLSPQGRETARL